MEINEDLQFLVNKIFFNRNGYVTEDELNELPNFIDILDNLENKLLELGLFIKTFHFQGETCYTIYGSAQQFETLLNKRESFMLINFIIRYEFISGDKHGIDKKKWKELILENSSGKKLSFNETLRNLQKMGFLTEKNEKIEPGWRYIAFLNIPKIKNGIKTEAKLNYLLKEVDEEENIID